MEYKGHILKLNIGGKSHGEKIEFSLEGIRKGHKIDLANVQKMLDRRSALGKDYATPRKEKDILNLENGIENGLTNGQIIKGYFINEDSRSKDYSIFKRIPRPSHIDYVAMNKYGKDYELAGSGEFSGRLSVAIVAAGAIAKEILSEKGIYLASHFKSLYGLEDDSFDPVNLSLVDFESLDPNLPFINKDLKKALMEMLDKFKIEKDSFGGIIELGVIGNTQNLGGPYFERLQASFSKALMSIPGSKGLEFGNGFEATNLKGSQNNDSFVFDDKIKTLTNRAGGINGGIANGMPIIIRLAIKPTSSIAKAQHTLDIENKKMVELEIEGRHDPAFILRTHPVAEAMLALALLDQVYLFEKGSLRDQIDSIDDKLMNLYLQRMAITDQVGKKKLEEGKVVYVPEREQAIIKRLSDRYPDYKKEISNLYETIFENSKLRQENIIKKASISYGLIGRTLGYSYSKEIHETLSDYKYELVELRPDELYEFLQSPGLKGLNVTIPYKKAVIPYLDQLTREASRIGVVNTIKFEDGKKIGFNTDYYGFKKLLINKRYFVKGKKAIILGTGASSKTVEAVLKNMGATDVVKVSRTGDLNYDNIYQLEGYQILVNTTPVGTYPNTQELLVDLDRLKGLEYLVDLVYNPLYSRLVFEAKKRKIKASGGLDMLVFQAKKAVEIFTNSQIVNFKAMEIRDKIFESKVNIVLVGMPGSGKTTIGRNLAKKIGKVHVDLDEEFFKEYNKTPAQILEEFGEPKFRQMEHEICKKFGAMNNLVISTGGGVVTIEDNYYHLKQNGVIFLIERDVTKLSTRNRPISQGGLGKLYKLKEKRQDKYEMFADYKVVNNGYFRYALEEIYELYKTVIKDL